MPIGRFEISDWEFEISDFNLRSRVLISNPQSAIRNQKMVEAPRIELGSKSQRRGIYMLSRFSCLSADNVARQKFAHCRVSEVTRPRQELVRLYLTRPHGPKGRPSLSE